MNNTSAASLSECNRQGPGYSGTTGAESILKFLTERQFLHPRASVASVLRLAEAQLRVCGLASQRAMDWLAVEEAQPIGRLRRAEITQLSRSIGRFMRYTGPSRPMTPCEVKRNESRPGDIQ